MVLTGKAESPVIKSADTIPSANRLPRAFPRSWLPAAFLVLLLIGYGPMLRMTAHTVMYSDDMAHGFFAPFIALYLIWCERASLLVPGSPPSSWSMAFFAAGACLGTAGALAASSTFARFGFILSLAGCFLLIGGWPILRRFSFPLGLLLFTFPVPDVYYGEITQPMQLLATRISEWALEALGFSVIREGNLLQLPHMRLSVVEACSGLRSLITLSFFCLVYGYFFEAKLWLRAAVALLAIPSAIAINALRITATGVLGKYNLAWTEGTYHEMVGWAALTLGFALVFAAHRLFRLQLRTAKPAFAR